MRSWFSFLFRKIYSEMIIKIEDGNNFKNIEIWNKIIINMKYDTINTINGFSLRAFFAITEVSYKSSRQLKLTVSYMYMHFAYFESETVRGEAALCLASPVHTLNSPNGVEWRMHICVYTYVPVCLHVYEERPMQAGASRSKASTCSY